MKKMLYIAWVLVISSMVSSCTKEEVKPQGTTAQPTGTGFKE
jgi:hypothetical protein